MKAGFCLHTDWLVTKPELVKVIDELGYDGIEIWAQAFDMVGIKEVKGIVDNLKCEVASVNPYFDFVSSEESYQNSLSIAEEYIGYSKMLDCTRIRTFTNKMNFFKTSDEAEDIHWERAIKGIQEVCDAAAPYGISCVMEVHYGDGQLYDTSESTIRIIKGVNRENLSVNLQLPMRGEDFYESAEKLGPYVTHVHAHNWIGKWGSFVNLDDKRGDVDNYKFISILRKKGYDGYISIEHTHRDPEGIARHEIEYLRKLFLKIG